MNIKHCLKTLMLAAGVFAMPVLTTTPCLADGSELRDDEFQEITKYSVARIITEQEVEGGMALGTGSGFLISSWGVVMTNRHVVDGVSPESCLVAFNFKDEIHCYRARYIEVCPDRDLALIVIPNSTNELPAPFSFSVRNIDIGAPIVTIGYPAIHDRFSNKKGNAVTKFFELYNKRAAKDKGKNGGEKDYVVLGANADEKDCLDFVNPTCGFGKVSNVMDIGSNYGCAIHHSATIDHGNSGGPLLDRQTGLVVGVNSFGVLDKEADGSVSASSNGSIAQTECRRFLRSLRMPIIEASQVHFLESMDAMRYYLGVGVQKSPGRAFDLFKKAADSKNGDPFAQLMTGICYLEPAGTTQDVDQALLYISKAAEMGMCDAQYVLGAYYTAQEDRASISLGKAWLKRAASQGYPAAIELLEKLK